MKTQLYLLILFVPLFMECNSDDIDTSYETGNLKIKKVASNTYVHISYLSTRDYGKVPCNGMIVVDNGEAIVFDTPVNDSTSAELIDWVTNSLKCKIKGVVVTHFHADCLGGLSEFHNHQIPSYANNTTIELAKSTNAITPENGFEDYLELSVGKERVIGDFQGEGHTADNIVGYFPANEVLFGGCLIKADGAGKGNLNDATIEEWSNTVRRIKSKYKNVKVVLPGHGQAGGTELLDYTIEKFKVAKSNPR